MHNHNNFSAISERTYYQLITSAHLAALSMKLYGLKTKIWLIASFQKYWRSKSVQTLGMEEHLDSVERVLRVHLEVGIRLQPFKKTFFLSKIDF